MSQDTRLLSVVILNWNSLAYIGDCLLALRLQTLPPGWSYEIVVVDNGSVDGSDVYVEREFPEVRLIRAGCNLGFAAGNTLGFLAARGEAIVTLNADTVPEPAFLGAILGAYLAARSAGRESVGMVAARLLSYSDPTRLDTAGIAIDRAGIAWDIGSGEPVVSTRPRDWPALLGPCAGAALYRRELIDRLGGFDEDFFVYLEDVDLALRARLLGYEVISAENARALHHHSASTGDDSPTKRYFLGRNKLLLIARDYPAPLFFVYLPVIIAFDLGALLAYFVRPPGGRASLRARLAALRGRLAGLAALPRSLGKRRAFQAERRRSSGPRGESLARLFAPVEPPWRAYRRFRH